MIHQSLIDAARNIRSQYERKQADLESTIRSTEEVKTLLEENILKIQEIGKQAAKQVGTVDSHKNTLMGVLSEIDEKSKSLALRLQSTNKDMEQLKEQEIRLFNVIKSRYPSMTDEEIKVEVQSRL
jgi:chromosome segregation ATPase